MGIRVYSQLGVKVISQGDAENTEKKRSILASCLEDGAPDSRIAPIGECAPACASVIQSYRGSIGFLLSFSSFGSGEPKWFTGFAFSLTNRLAETDGAFLCPVLWGECSSQGENPPRLSCQVSPPSLQVEK